VEDFVAPATMPLRHRGNSTGLICIKAAGRHAITLSATGFVHPRLPGKPRERGITMTTLRDVRQTIQRLIDNGRKRRQLKRELAQLAAMGDLDAVLADIGLARSQVGPLLAEGPESSDLLDRMLARLGIDAARLAPEIQRDMTWTCLACPDKRQCRRWLADRVGVDFHSFCPNAPALDRASSEQGLPLSAGRPAGETYCPTADEERRRQAEARRREVRTLLDGAL
jgi:hypothetical protein